MKIPTIAIIPYDDGSIMRARMICNKNCMPMTLYCSSVFQIIPLVADFSLVRFNIKVLF